MSYERCKRPESVLVVVYTVAAEVLVLRRRWPADFWQSVTGSLEWNEDDPLIAARRELWEETGLKAQVQIVNCGIINRFPIQPAWQHFYGSARENTEYVFRTTWKVNLELPREVSGQAGIKRSSTWSYA